MIAWGEIGLDYFVPATVRGHSLAEPPPGLEHVAELQMADRGTRVELDVPVQIA